MPYSSIYCSSAKNLIGGMSNKIGAEDDGDKLPDIRSHTGKASQLNFSIIDDQNEQSKLRSDTVLSDSFMNHSNSFFKIDSKAPDDQRQTIDVFQRKLTQVDVPGFLPLDQKVTKGDNLSTEEKNRYAELWPLVAKK